MIIKDDLKYQPICVQWIPRILMAEQKQKRIDMCTRYVAHFNEEGYMIFMHIIKTISFGGTPSEFRSLIMLLCSIHGFHFWYDVVQSSITHPDLNQSLPNFAHECTCVR